MQKEWRALNVRLCSSFLASLGMTASCDVRRSQSPSLRASEARRSTRQQNESFFAFQNRKAPSLRIALVFRQRRRRQSPSRRRRRHRPPPQLFTPSIQRPPNRPRSTQTATRSSLCRRSIEIEAVSSACARASERATLRECRRRRLVLAATPPTSVCFGLPPFLLKLTKKRQTRARICQATSAQTFFISYAPLRPRPRARNVSPFGRLVSCHSICRSVCATLAIVVVGRHIGHSQLVRLVRARLFLVALSKQFSGDKRARAFCKLILIVCRLATATIA